MAIDILEQKLRTLPEHSFEEIDTFFDYIIYKFGTKSQSLQPTMSDEEARIIFNQFSGSITREIDYKKEREIWRDEIDENSH